jgi:hypothetical protein
LSHAQAYVKEILIVCVLPGYVSRQQADALLAGMIALGCRSPIDSLEPLIGE